MYCILCVFVPYSSFQKGEKAMKMKKIVIVAAMLLSFLLITVTALAMQSSSEKNVNSEPQPVQNCTEVNSNGTPSIIRSAVLPGSATTPNESEENKEPVLGQTYTEVNPNARP